MSPPRRAFGASPQGGPCILRYRRTPADRQSRIRGSRLVERVHASRAADAFVWACGLDVSARKPGNVSLASPGHGMQAAHFLASSAACAQPLCRTGARVGERIEAAVRATLEAAQCNTNLGIVLLCAPLAAAHELSRAEEGVTGLRAALSQVLDALDLDDARAAYRAIALASPGGLGSAEQQDVADEPSIDLRAAMVLAAHRDRIAFQYAHGFADVFDLGLPTFVGCASAHHPRGEAHRCAEAHPTGDMQRAYLEFLAAFPDSHIVRKHGRAVAHSVMAEAQAWRNRARRGAQLDADAAFAAWDESLKARGLNPGTSADLSVATAFVAQLLRQPRAL
jgi:triphosphoribosyl-dephospho-CoA synthase